MVDPYGMLRDPCGMLRDPCGMLRDEDVGRIAGPASQVEDGRAWWQRAQEFFEPPYSGPSVFTFQTRILGCHPIVALLDYLLGIFARGAIQDWLGLRWCCSECVTLSGALKRLLRT
jgi:hypothetical protein